MTFAEYQRYARNIHNRADRVAKVIRDRARDIGEKRLGSGRDMCFLCAHNWQGQSWMTPEKNQAAREILYLQQKAFEPGTIADRIMANAWKKLREESA